MTTSRSAKELYDFSDSRPHLSRVGVLKEHLGGGDALAVVLWVIYLVFIHDRGILSLIDRLLE